MAERYSDHFCQSGQLKDRERNPIIRAPAKFTTYEDIREATKEIQREEEALKTSPKFKPLSSMKREALKKKLDLLKTSSGIRPRGESQATSSRSDRLRGEGQATSSKSIPPWKKESRVVKNQIPTKKGHSRKKDQRDVPVRHTIIRIRKS